MKNLIFTLSSCFLLIQLSTANTLSIDTVATPCDTSFNVAVNNITGNTAEVSWQAGLNSLGFNIRYKVLTDSIWNYDTTSVTTYPIFTLSPCTEYEVEIESICDSGITSGYSIPVDFTTSCCNSVLSTSIFIVAQTTVYVRWNNSNNGGNYNLRFKKLTDTTWNNFYELTDTSFVFDSLDRCTDYEYQVQSSCDSSSGMWIAVDTFKTKGCTSCDTLGSSCDAYGNNSSILLDSMVMQEDFWNDNIWLYGTNNHGYSEDSLNVFHIDGAKCVSRIILYHDTSTGNVFYGVYADWNKDGIFDMNNETIYSSSSSEGYYTDVWIYDFGWSWFDSSTITLRIIASDQAITNTCGYIGNGDVFDHCIVPGTICGAIEETSAFQNIHCQPNPFTNQLAVDFESTENGEVQLALVNLLGQTIQTQKTSIIHGENHFTLPVQSNLSPGTYLLQLQDVEGNISVVKINRE